jgi:hypothetical protein
VAGGEETNKLKIYDRLLKYMYDEYNAGHNASGHGEYVRVLVAHFERISESNRIGDAHAKRAAVDYLHKNGWISVVDILGNQIRNSIIAYGSGRMQPTQKGRDYLQQKRIDAANAIASVSGTFWGKFLRSLLGK